MKIVKSPYLSKKYYWILTKFGVLQHILNLMRFSKALLHYLRSDKINEQKQQILMEKT